MKLLLIVFVVFVVASPCLSARITRNTSPSFNVVDYGAMGNGQTDDSQAFVKAWQEACGATEDTTTLLIPKRKTFMLQPVSFRGPCNPATINIKLEGAIIAPKRVEAWKWPKNDRDTWIQFSAISGLVINGGGQIDGQGAAWWNCYSNSNCDRPTALHFHDCEKLVLSGLTHINSPRNHISLNACNGVVISKLHITAPADSPNTDGIDISKSSNVVIKNSKMETGDDCVAINHGSTFISIIDVFCGPGHGISVGSLGQNGAYHTVEEIYVRNCTFSGTTNGARIKTWMGGRGYARRITFEDIILIAAKNPVIIDQQYNPYDSVNAVRVSDVTYRNVRGTSSGEHAIKLHCDKTIGCTNILLERINITSLSGEETCASCKNAKGVCSSCIPNVPCLTDNY
ncbi:probable polygalacturonase At3g15720 [Gastrolobium bilobum]|uniref:probable polygalacturonase At3g15720 n=1 Tax=Gastrolobium bilobum TaxID=150636 RepID=UPI002AB2A087|nr:probable polygalacturonase At3g15720 [Gastrolobium bilobum]